jgi:hypothetical protein
MTTSARRLVHPYVSSLVPLIVGVKEKKAKQANPYGLKRFLCIYYQIIIDLIVNDKSEVEKIFLQPMLLS